VGKERAFQNDLDEHLPPHRDSGWVIRVRPLEPGRQRIELFLMGDGY